MLINSFFLSRQDTDFIQDMVPPLSFLLDCRIYVFVVDVSFVRIRFKYDGYLGCRFSASCLLPGPKFEGNKHPSNRAEFCLHSNGFVQQLLKYFYNQHESASNDASLSHFDFQRDVLSPNILINYTDLT